ncbi:MAG: DUF1934 domain-containing protein [Acutalibacteraceae bacterium]|nr:DUF1934 domain-containing protein [Acutalibacteraceae bacterium]
MKPNEYLIEILGTQEIEGEDSDKVDVTTVGQYTVAPTGNKFIRYAEYDSENLSVVQNTTIKIADNIITITRDGNYGSQLMLEIGKRHQCHYSTPMGELMIGVYTHKMDIALDENGGEMSVAYTLDFDTAVVSENTFKITVSKKLI